MCAIAKKAKLRRSGFHRLPSTYQTHIQYSTFQNCSLRSKPPCAAPLPQCPQPGGAGHEPPNQTAQFQFDALVLFGFEGAGHFSNKKALIGPKSRQSDPLASGYYQNEDRRDSHRSWSFVFWCKLAAACSGVRRPYFPYTLLDLMRANVLPTSFGTF